MRPGVFAVYRWELRKLRFQKRTYLGLGAAAAVPIIFAVAVGTQNGQPNDVAFATTRSTFFRNWNRASAFVRGALP